MHAPFPSNFDMNLFHEGYCYHSDQMFGAHICEWEEITGVRFTVWAPHAQKVRVVGSFNNWDGTYHSMYKHERYGIWSLFVPELTCGELYKYEILTQNGETILKSDPYAVYSECRPNTASIVYSLAGYVWNDQSWQTQKRQFSNHIAERPMNIYEVHLGSWKRKSDGTFYTYRELAEELVSYVKNMGYTHIELLPISEHPYDRSWGYQQTGYFSVTSRFGSPHDFMYFVDHCHQSNIGVILDWVPGHFGKDAHGLRLFDGSPLYEYQDPQKAEKTQWGTLAFDHGKPEVQSYLISNALFWYRQYHIDGIRVDAVTSMLYLDFEKPHGEWTPNRYGGRENLESIDFLQKVNQAVKRFAPGCIQIAEESTDWTGVTQDSEQGGLGFHLKWNMGWMNDTLRYAQRDPIHRKYHHNELTFSIMYTYSERFLLALSHDEVVHGKRSLLHKMPGTYEQKFASLRVLLGYMMTHPGKKLVFMGGEIAQFDEWKDEEQMDWFLLEYASHRHHQQYVRDLNHFYREHPSLWEMDDDYQGFQWIDADNADQSIVSYIRKSKQGRESLVTLCNFTTTQYPIFRIGVPKLGVYHEVFNSDQTYYCGTGYCNRRPVLAEKVPWHNQPFSIVIQVAPLSILILQQQTQVKRQGILL